MPGTRRHPQHVYVVEPDAQVWNELRFRKANPDHPLRTPLVHVGMTGTDTELRFDKHKAGFEANRFVQSCALRLLSALYEVCDPVPYKAAREMEVELAIALRAAGHGARQT